MDTFTKEDIDNIIGLIKLAPINGAQALVVAGLLYKLSVLIQETKTPMNTTNPAKEVSKLVEVKKVTPVETLKKK